MTAARNSHHNHPLILSLSQSFDMAENVEQIVKQIQMLWALYQDHKTLLASIELRNIQAVSILSLEKAIQLTTLIENEMDDLLALIAQQTMQLGGMTNRQSL